MSDFGFAGFRIGIEDGSAAMVDAWSAGPFAMAVGAKIYLFTDSDRFGPLVESKRGLPLENQPRERDSFWRQHRIWARQGRRLGGPDGLTCLWEEPKAEKIMRMSGRNYYVVEAGEEDGKTIVLERDIEFLKREFLK